jgi:hypothetical protein
MIWIALSIGMVALLLFSLMSIAKQQDRTARRIEKKRDPFSDVEITVTGSSGVITMRSGRQAMRGGARDAD